MLSPSFSYAPWRRWDGVSPSISISPSCCRHVSFFMLFCPFLMLSPSFSYAPWRRWDGGSPSISMSPSCGRHVSFYVNQSFFLCCLPLFLMLHGAGGTGGLLPSPCLHPVVDTFLFMLISPFFYAVSLFFLCSMAQVGRAVSFHLHVSILLSTRFFFNANLSFSYAVPRAGGTGGEGHPFTRPDHFLAFFLRN